MCLFCTIRPQAQYSTVKKHLFALGLKLMDPVLTHAYRPQKNSLLDNLSGKILEAGPGTGLNFRYYARGSTVIAVEPNIHLHPYLKQSAARNGLELELHSEPGESMDIPDNTADAAVITLVLCSVSDPGKVAAEIRRVLKPGRQLLFIEHVAAPENTRLQRVQRFVKPLWKQLFDGCHPDRNTRRTIENAGFSKTRVEDFRLSVPVVSTHISGTAIK